MANRSVEIQGSRNKIIDNLDGTFIIHTVIIGGSVSARLEFQGYLIALHDNGDGTFSPMTTSSTGAGDQSIEMQGFRLKIHPTGSTDPATGKPLYAIVVA